MTVAPADPQAFCTRLEVLRALRDAHLIGKPMASYEEAVARLREFRRASGISLDELNAAMALPAGKMNQYETTNRDWRYVKRTSGPKFFAWCEVLGVELLPIQVVRPSMAAYDGNYLPTGLSPCPPFSRLSI